MRAVRVSAFGGPEVLKYVTDAQVPRVGHSQVLVKTHAAGFNPVDTYIRSGTNAIKPSLPYTPGSTTAGIISKIGDGVKSFKAGDRVYTCCLESFGGYAEFTVCDEANVFHLPDSLSFKQGAVLGVPYFTAYRVLFQKLNAKPFETVLIHGASGGVGLAAVQFSKAKDMVVMGTAGTEEGMALVKNAGADHVFNHRSPSYTKEIMDKTEGKGVDLIVENLANVNLDKDLDLLAVNGRIGVVGSRARIEIDPRKTMGKESWVIGTALRRSSKADFEEYSRRIQAGADEGWLKPIIGKEYKLEDASSAHEEVNSSGAKGGKIILTIE